MPHASKDEPAPRVYPITQAELAEYRRLNGAISRQLSILAYRRGRIMAGMGGAHVVEPGGLKPVVVYRNTGTYMLDDDGDQVEVVKRHLTIIEEA